MSNAVFGETPGSNIPQDHGQKVRNFLLKYYTLFNFGITNFRNYIYARRAGSDGSMSPSGSAGPGFDPRQGRKFSL